MFDNVLERELLAAWQMEMEVVDDADTFLQCLLLARSYLGDIRLQ